MKHTPAPWSAQINNCNHAIISPDGFDVATISANYYEAEANARLIAASPELLAALTRAVAYLDANRPKGKIADIFSKLNEHENDVLKPARAAIAKATGGAK